VNIFEDKIRASGNLFSVVDIQFLIDKGKGQLLFDQIQSGTIDTKVLYEELKKLGATPVDRVENLMMLRGYNRGDKITSYRGSTAKEQLNLAVDFITDITTFNSVASLSKSDQLSYLQQLTKFFVDTFKEPDPRTEVYLKYQRAMVVVNLIEKRRQPNAAALNKIRSFDLATALKTIADIKTGTPAKGKK
jgi:hypothetical protein